ncbi:hypothetical protein BDW71DRAFT_202428 [Aspergillus fruticulosus]
MGAITTTVASRVLEVPWYSRTTKHTRPLSGSLLSLPSRTARAKHLNFEITYSLWDLNDRNNSLTRSHDLRFANWTSDDPYFVHEFFSVFDANSHWILADLVDLVYDRGFRFRSQQDLSRVRESKYSVAINLTDKTMSMPMWVNWSGGEYTNDTCVVVAASPSPMADPCRVDIDSTIVARMEASLKPACVTG